MFRLILTKSLPAMMVFAMACSAVDSASSGERGQWVRISHDNGGSVVTYAMSVLSARQSGQRVQITGVCNSACTLFLAMPRNQLCASRDASFGFHLPSGTSPEGVRGATRYLLGQYPGWVREWIASRGGLTNQLKVMQYSDFKNTLSPCAAVASN